MNKFIVFFLLMFQSTVHGYSTHYFSTSLDVLNTLTKNYALHREEFMTADYSNYTLFRAITLNDFLINDVTSKNLSDFFCRDDGDELIKLLKWKMAVKFQDSELGKAGISCTDKIQKHRDLMEGSFLNGAFYDAFVEYYYFLDSSANTDFLLKDSLLKAAIYKKPDIKVLELSIAGFRKEKLAQGEWNASILAARYGSTLGFNNMIRISKIFGESEFMDKVNEFLWKDLH